MKPRLLLITNRLVVGGISNDIIPLAYYLQNDFDILILHGEKEKDEAEANFLLSSYRGLHLKKIKAFKKNNNPLNNIIAYTAIKKEIKNFKPDIVHTHGAKSGFMGRLAAYKIKVPVIIHTFHGHHFHSYYNKFISSFILKSERWLGTFTNCIIAISVWQKKELTEIYKIISPQKVKIISLGIDAKANMADSVTQRNNFRKKYAVEDDAIAIGIAGRIVPVKNLKLFVEVAAALISATKKKLAFFIMGDGLLKKEIIHQCKKLNINFTETPGEQASIIFTSWIENIIPAIQAMDIVALTSFNEGTPVSLIEAQWYGKPVVATDVGGIKDIVVNGETGFLVKPGDENTMIKKLKLLAENNNLRKTMGEKATAFAFKNFSKQTEVENYKQLYQSLLTPKNIERSANEPAPIK